MGVVTVIHMDMKLSRQSILSKEIGVRDSFRAAMRFIKHILNGTLFVLAKLFLIQMGCMKYNKVQTMSIKTSGFCHLIFSGC